MKYLKIRIEVGTSNSIFDIYYDSISNDTRALLYDTGLPAIGLTNEVLEFGEGVTVSVPDNATSIILNSNPAAFCTEIPNVNNDAYTIPIGCMSYTVSAPAGIFNYFYTDCDCNSVTATIDATYGYTEETFCALQDSVSAGFLTVTYNGYCSTPALYSWNFGPGYISGVNPCLSPTLSGVTLYTTGETLDVNTQMYSSYPTIFDGLNLWYRKIDNDTIYRIYTNGQIQEIIPCWTLKCVKWDVAIYQSDLDSATGNTQNPDRNGKVFVDFTDCYETGNTSTYTATTAGPVTDAFCGKYGQYYPEIKSYYFRDDKEYGATSWYESFDAPCSVGTTCNSYSVSSSGGTISYLRCGDGEFITETLPPNYNFTLCSIGGIAYTAGISVTPNGGIC